MYHIVFALLYLISLIPFRIIYLISDAAAFFIYHVVRYRRDVVRNNLLIAFPEKSEAERKKIEKEFYRNFTDNFIETIKLLSISEKELRKRFTSNFELLEDLYREGLKVQGHLGHFFNWEYANAAHGLHTQFPFLVVYMPIKSKAMERLFRKLRTRFSTKLIPANAYRKHFMPYAKGQYCLILVADQNPGEPDNSYWLPFFGRMTPFVNGPERGARLNNTAIITCNCYKVKRGYYHSELALVTKAARELPEGEVTRRIVSFLEEAIRRRPANYLWSHRRWKWEFNPEKHSKNVIATVATRTESRT